MVRFEGDKIIIEIAGNGDPVGVWSDIVVELIDVLGALDKDLINMEQIRSVTRLLGDMMPYEKLLKRME